MFLKKIETALCFLENVCDYNETLEYAETFINTEDVNEQSYKVVDEKLTRIIGRYKLELPQEGNENLITKTIEQLGNLMLLKLIDMKNAINKQTTKEDILKILNLLKLYVNFNDSNNRESSEIYQLTNIQFRINTTCTDETDIKNFLIKMEYNNLTTQSIQVTEDGLLVNNRPMKLIKFFNKKLKEIINEELPSDFVTWYTSNKPCKKTYTLVITNNATSILNMSTASGVKDGITRWSSCQNYANGQAYALSLFPTLADKSSLIAYVTDGEMTLLPSQTCESEEHERMITRYMIRLLTTKLENDYIVLDRAYPNDAYTEMVLNKLVEICTEKDLKCALFSRYNSSQGSTHFRVDEYLHKYKYERKPIYAYTKHFIPSLRVDCGDRDCCDRMEDDNELCCNCECTCYRRTHYDDNNGANTIANAHIVDEHKAYKYRYGIIPLVKEIKEEEPKQDGVTNDTSIIQQLAEASNEPIVNVIARTERINSMITRALNHPLEVQLWEESDVYLTQEDIHQIINEQLQALTQAQQRQEESGHVASATNNTEEEQNEDDRGDE